MKVKQYRIGKIVWNRCVSSDGDSFFEHEDDEAVEIVDEKTLIAMGAVPVSEPQLPEKLKVPKNNNGDYIAVGGLDTGTRVLINATWARWAEEVTEAVNQIIDYLEKREE